MKAIGHLWNCRPCQL